MRKWLTVLVVLLLSFSLVIGACAPKAPTPTSPAEFYAKNTITNTITFGPGGGVDYAGRLFSSYWSSVVEGGTMVVKNMEGGGGLVGANYVYAAKPDGLIIGTGMVGATHAPAVIFEDPGRKFELGKFDWIIHTNTAAHVLTISPKLPYNTLDELRKAEGLKFATTGATNKYAVGAIIVIELLGLKNAKIIAGYGSSADASLALSRGEVDAFVASEEERKVNIERGLAKGPFLTVELERGRLFPNLPTITEIAKPSPKQLSLVNAYATSMMAGQTVFAPQGISPDKLLFLRSKFEEMTKLKGFQTQSKLQWPILSEPIKGADMEQKIKELVTIPKEDVAQIKQLLDKYVQAK
ncbi:MAG: hypothetical protein HYX79_07535 [Chloroflexi bacterium]|nr:hypothetical protein [Chloroflexota bacterium]